MIVDDPVRPRVLRPALTAAAISSSLVATGFGVLAFLVGAIGFAREGDPVIGLMYAPVVGAGLAIVCGILGLLPALAWIAGALFVGPRIWLSKAGRFRGVLLGAACTAPAYLVGHWIGRAEPFGASALIGPAMDLAVIFAGVLAGLIMIRLMRASPPRRRPRG